ncbi:MAG: AI-2E family transporter, partial [Phycisphaerales bacterium]|nr:AI-2E family transporter [Phycisphaerales bacterium]
EGLLKIAQQTGDVALGVLGSIVRFGILAVLIPFYFFFFSLWFPQVVAFARSLIPDDGRSDIESLLAKMDAAIAGFVRGRIVIAAIMGAVLAVGWMAVGVPYAIILGLGIGVLCAVPFLGLIGIPLSIGLLFLEQLGLPESSRMAWWGILVWPTLIFGIVQALDGWILTPLIAGKATNLDPVTIFVAVLAGGSVLGAYGMLLAIPVAACIKITLQEVVLPNIRAWARGEANDPLPFED